MIGAFTLATIAREPWPVLSRFLGWRLEQVAERIIPFPDDPNDPALPRLMAESRIDPRPCTPEFWAELGLTPTTRFIRRQRAILTQAFRELQSGWLLVLDADELVRFQDRLAEIAASDAPKDEYCALFDRLHRLTAALADALEAANGLLRNAPPHKAL